MSLFYSSKTCSDLLEGWGKVTVEKITSIRKARFYGRRKVMTHILTDFFMLRGQDDSNLKTEFLVDRTTSPEKLSHPSPQEHSPAPAARSQGGHRTQM